jgi:hypothetical protein
MLTILLPLLLSQGARADEPAATAPPPVAKSEPIDVGTISLSGEVPVPEVVIFTPRITTQEASTEQLSALIDQRLEEAAARR